MRVCFFVPIHSLKEAWLVSGHKKSRQAGFVFFFGGERGIRTLDKLLTYTHFPGVLLKPLGHLSLNGLTKVQFFSDSGVTHLTCDWLLEMTTNHHRIGFLCQQHH